MFAVILANVWCCSILILRMHGQGLGYRFSCDDMDESIIPGVQSLLNSSLAKGIPIIYTTTAFCSFFDMGGFPVKAPLSNDLILGSLATDIDDKIVPEPGVDTLIVKKAAERICLHSPRRHSAGGQYRYPDLHRRYASRMRSLHGRGRPRRGVSHCCRARVCW